MHSCGVSLTPNALAAVRTTGAPTTAAPTYAPDGTPPVAAALRWVGPAHSGGPRSAAADAAMAVPRSLTMASAAERPRRTARAGSALSAAVNVTYAAVDVGLVAWLNNQMASYASTTVHVTLPSGNVARGNAPLRLPYGINLILQGQGMAGASNTTLDLEKRNLAVGGMLGDSGRIEFRNMRVHNVRPRLARAAVHVFPMTLRPVCAGLRGAPASPDAGRCAPPAALCSPPLLVCAACFMHRDRAVRPVAAPHCIGWSVVACVVRCASHGCVVVARCNRPYATKRTQRSRGCSRASSWVELCVATTSHALHTARAPCELP